MDPDFWRARWRAGEIGFHQASASWALVSFGDRLAIEAGTRVLVPLAGKSLDLAHLAAAGASVTGVELVEDAVRSFYAERGWTPERAIEGDYVHYRTRGTGRDVELWAGDFFRFEAPSFPLIFDRAALIALPRELRVHYAQKLRALLAPGGRLLLVTLDYPQAQRDGPPFAVAPDEVEALFAGLAIERLATRDALDESPRFRAAGVERLDETAWLIRAA